MRYPDLPDSLNDFLEKNLDLNAEGHNIYHIQSVDKDGNVTNEAFGLNTMTYSGLWYLYQNSAYWPDSEYSSHWRGRLWLGSGTSEPDKNSDVLEAPSTVITTQPVINAIWNDTPAEVYDSVSDTLSSTLKIVQYYYDYNISGVNSDYSFSEIGLNLATSSGYNIPGYNSYPLFVHALLYDSEGHQISFTKKMNERLYITIYFRYSMKMSIVRDLYDEDIYMTCSAAAFSTHSRWGSGYWAFLSPMYDKVITQQRISGYLFNGNASNNEIDVMSQSINFGGSTLIESQYNSAISTIYLRDGAYGMDNAYRSLSLFVENEKLPEPEELSSELVYIDGNQYINKDHLSIRHSFGGHYHSGGSYNWIYTDVTSYSNISNYGILPVADFNMTSSKMWNYITGEWDIDENIDAQPNCYLNNTFANPTAMVLELDGTRTPCFVYTNPRTDIPISKFHNANWGVPSPMYATDEYWDTTTWGLIASPGSSIPANLQNKKYYISKTINEDSYRDGRILPERVQSYPSIIVPQAGYTVNMTDTVVRTDVGYSFLSSDAGNWFMTNTKLCYPDIDVDPIIYQMPTVSRPGPSESTRDMFVASCGYRWNTDDRIFIADMGGHVYNYQGWQGFNYNRFRVYTVSDDGSAPTYVEMRIDIGGGIVPTADGDGIAFNNYFVYNFNGTRYVTFYVPNVAWKIGFVDIYGQDDVTPEITVLSGGLMAYAEPIYGTNLMIYHESFTSTSPGKITANSQWVLYDMSTKIIVNSFEFSSDYYDADINCVAGFGNHVYIKITKSSTTYTFHYDVITHQYAIMEGINDRGFVYSYPGVYDSQHLGHRFNTPIVFNEKCMYVFGYAGGNTNNPQMGYMYTDDDPMHPSQSMFKDNVDLRYMFGKFPKLWETPDHKHLICTTDGFNCWENNAYGARVFDMGYFIKTKKSICYPHWQTRLGPEGSFTAIGYYKNGFIVNLPTGTIYWVPLEFYLPHKVTGTTRTIQSYNNPRVYSGMGFTFYVGLRDNLWKYDGRAVSFDGADAVQEVLYSKQNTTLEITPTSNCLLVAIVFSYDSDVVVTENVDSPGYWTFKEQMSITYSTWVQKYLTIYTKQGVAGTTYTFTAKNGTIYTNDNDDALFNAKIFALYGASSITKLSETSQSSVTYSVPANTGKRRLIIDFQAGDINWDADCPYKWSEPHHILPGMFTMPGRHAVWYDPFITDTTVRTLTYRRSWPGGTGFSKFIIYEINET